MTKKVLLDANLLIRAFDGDPGNDEDMRALGEIQRLNDDPEVELLAITPLIRFEVLRGIRRDSPAELKEAITRLDAQLDNYFADIQITSEVARLAADVYRYVQAQRTRDSTQSFLDLRRHGFDLLHCACADIFGLQIISQDAHIPKIQQLISDSRQ